MRKMETEAGRLLLPRTGYRRLLPLESKEGRHCRAKAEDCSSGFRSFGACCGSLRGSPDATSLDEHLGLMLGYLAAPGVLAGVKPGLGLPQADDADAPGVAGVVRAPQDDDADADWDADDDGGDDAEDDGDEASTGDMDADDEDDAEEDDTDDADVDNADADDADDDAEHDVDDADHEDTDDDKEGVPAEEVGEEQPQQHHGTRGGGDRAPLLLLE